VADLYWPFNTDTISEWCGTDRGNGKTHTGTDFAIAQGTELRATITGTIQRWNNDGLGAYVLDIIRNDGLLVRNAHLSAMYVNTGDWVEAGQIIGLTGGTPGTAGAGYSTGPHLHWELRWDRLWNGGNWVDPRNLAVGNFGDASTPVSLAGNQRMAGALGVFRRAQPTQESERLEGDLEAGDIGNFDGWINGEDRNGNPVWFRGISGNWFWSGAFTDTGTHDLADLNPAPIVTPEPVPPIVEPVTPEPEAPPVDAPITPEIPPTITPETPPTEEKPVANQTDEQIRAQQTAFAASIKPVDLGSIITDNRTRKIVWAVYGITGLVLLAAVGGMNAAGWLSPEWFLFMLGSYAALGPAFSGLAVANISTGAK